jgi:hypothetical protein
MSMVIGMTDALNEFHYWLSAKDKAAVARDQANRHVPSYLIPPLHKGTPVMPALIAERDGLMAWYQALADASLKPVDAERYRAFTRILPKLKP